MGEKPGRAREKLDFPTGARERRDLGRARDRAVLVKRLVVGGRRLLEAAKPQALLPRRLLDLGEEIMDRLMAGGCHAHTPAAAHQLGD